MTKIILVRHCEAQGNHERVFQGATDCDITERGERQLEALSERFRTVEFDALYSSPLLRARRTAEAVNRHHGLPMAIEPGLREINAGHWEGKKRGIGIFPPGILLPRAGKPCARFTSASRGPFSI